MNALNKKTVDDINVKGQKVLVRCDFNVPLKNGVITDENRIIAALPTIKKLISDGGRVILWAHTSVSRRASPSLSFLSLPLQSAYPSCSAKRLFRR